MPIRTQPVLPEDEWLVQLEVGEGGIGYLTLSNPEKLNVWS